jgi:predicted CoA-binding protein
MVFLNPTSEQIGSLLNAIHSVAIVGLSPDPARPSFQVARGLQSLGYRILPVRPLADKILGEQVYATLDVLPELPDLVNVFRAPQHVPGIVEACIKLGIKTLWLQEGVIHEAAALRAQQAGIMVVMNRCLWRDARQLKGMP